MNLIILGPQGSGKGTQAGLLSQKFNLVHIDMGLALRHAARKKTELGKKINRIINNKKELVPDEIAGKVLAEELKKISKSRGIILDGAPRRKNQIGLVEKIFSQSRRKIDKIIYVNISDRESVKRIFRRYECPNCFARFVLGKDIQSAKSKCPACGERIKKRMDDTPRGIRKRLGIFRKETLPVISHYAKEKKVLEVDGRKEIDKVFKEIVARLAGRDNK